MIYVFLIVVALISSVHGNGPDFEGRLSILEEKISTLEEKVLQQQEEIHDQRHELTEKSNMIQELVRYLTEHDSVSEETIKRFVTDSGRPDDVAFFARVDASEIAGIKMNQTIIFENVILNVGNRYDAKTGVFTAPVDGLFLFAVTLTSDLGHFHELQVALQKNDVDLTRVHAHGDSGHLDQGGASIVTALTAGDHVAVRSVSADGQSLYGNGMTTFSGYHIMFK